MGGGGLQKLDIFCKLAFHTFDKYEPTLAITAFIDNKHVHIYVRMV